MKPKPLEQMLFYFSTASTKSVEKGNDSAGLEKP